MQRRPQSKNGRITLRDVITHISHVGQRVHRIEERMTCVEKGMDGMEKRLDAKIERNTIAIQDLKEHLTRRIDALDEDLTATIMDTITIRKHVGMPVPEDA